MAKPCITSTLTSAVNGSCINQIVGVEMDTALIAHSNIVKSGITYETGTFIVNNLDLVGNSAAKITVKGDLPYSETNVEGTMGTFVQLFNSTFAFPILENSPATAKQVAELGNDHYLAVVQFKGYDPAKKNKYGLIGLNRGLHFSTGNFSMASQEEFGWRIELLESEGLVPLFFFWDTDEATTDAWFNGLFT